MERGGLGAGGHEDIRLKLNEDFRRHALPQAATLICRGNRPVDNVDAPQGPAAAFERAAIEKGGGSELVGVIGKQQSVPLQTPTRCCEVVPNPVLKLAHGHPHEGFSKQPLQLQPEPLAVFIRPAKDLRNRHRWHCSKCSPIA